MQATLAANGQHSLLSLLGNHSTGASNDNARRNNTAATSSTTSSSKQQQQHSALTRPQAGSYVASETVLDSPSSPDSITTAGSDFAPSSPFEIQQHDVDLSPLPLSSPLATDSAAAPLLAPAVTVAGVTSARPSGRIPLSQVVESLTHQWSVEYLRDAEAGDTEAMCLVAQMYCDEGGWGALKENQDEGKRWLLRAKAGGAGCNVDQLEDRYCKPLSRNAVSSQQQLEGGYLSGYSNSPISSPTQAAGDRANNTTRPLSQTQSFLAQVANAFHSNVLHPKPSSRPSPPPPPARAQQQATTSSLSRSLSHDQFRPGNAHAVPQHDLRRAVSSSGGGENGTGSASGDDGQRHDQLPQLAHVHHRALMSH